MVATPQVHNDANPLWQGPCGKGPLGGITQSMLARFFSCRDRFRLKYVHGLEPHDKWNHRIGYGNMWHACEEALAEGSEWEANLVAHNNDMMLHYPMQAGEIEKWCNVCQVQFPEYVKYWSEHPDVQNRTPLLQEQVFDVPYTLPSGRTVRLRGKWDSVDLISDETTGRLGRHRDKVAGIYIQENKTKGDIDKLQVERQLKFDLQTMLYLIALERFQEATDLIDSDDPLADELCGHPVLGVRYNVVRRPLSGGRGNIKPHAAKSTKTKFTPAESAEDYYERLRREYIAAEPEYWFFRIRAEISQHDVRVFRDTCLDPLLETLCWWYDEVTGAERLSSLFCPPMNYRSPFGMYSALEEGGATEYDAYLETGNEAGLRRVESLFPELQ